MQLAHHTRTNDYDRRMMSSRLFLTAALAACGACGGDDAAASSGVTMSATFDVVAESPGTGPSHYDVLVGQTVSIEVAFPDPVMSYSMAGGCPTTVLEQAGPMLTATGASAAAVEAEVFAQLPDWSMRRRLCQAGSQAAV